MRYLVLVIIIIFVSTGSVLAQAANSVCSAATPFCSGSTSQYPAGTAGNNANLPYMGCLGSAPNPAWFSIPISQSGSISIVISATYDVDFICFGPFSASDILSGASCNSLTANTQVPTGPNPFSSPTNTSQGCSYSGSPTETLIIANAVVGEYYTLLVTNFSQQQQQINMDPSGTGAIGNMTVTGTSSVCAGGTATMDVTPGSGIVSINWTGPNGNFGSNYAQTVHNLQTTSIYTITGMTAIGQSCTATHEVIVQPLPMPVIANNGPICDGQTANFIVSGVNSYSVTGPALFSYNASASSFSIGNAHSNNMGIYTFRSTLNTCTNVATNQLIVKPNPTVTVAKGGDFCFGKSFNLLSNGATTYTWSGPNSFNYQGQNPLFINNAFNMSGAYSVIGETNGCQSTGTVDVTINPLPNIIASTTGTACQNASLTINASGAVSYVWAGPNGFTSHQTTVTITGVQLSASGVYSATGTDLNGCVNTGTVYQQVRPNPYVNIYSTDACVDKSIQLSSSGGISYYWEGPASFTSNDQNPVINNASTFNAGAYNVTVTSSYGCVASASVPVNVFLNPIINVTGNIEVCKGKSFYFTAHGALNYKWLNSTGIVTQDPLFSISSISPELEGTYTLVGTDGHFCSGLIPFYPIVNQPPVARIIPDAASGCAPLCTNITLDFLSPDITGAAWQYSDGKTIASSMTSSYNRCLQAPGIYTLNILLTDAKTCTSVVSNTLEAYVSPDADFSYTPDQPTENDNVITFVDQSRNIGAQSWSWNFYTVTGSLKDTSAKQSPTLTYPEVGNYLVYMKVTAANGCSDSIAKILVLVEDPTFFIPSAFTPNGDGLNDVFVPKSKAVVNYEMQVFTRWGMLLFSTTDPDKGWDGKSGSEVLPTDTYIYKFTVSNADKNPKVYKGQFSLIK